MHLAKISHFYSELNHSPIQSIQTPATQQRAIQLDVKRDDLLHPIISGNKWRKLKHLLLHIETSGFKHICVMGGPYSNLLHSLAYLGHRLGWKVELIVRGYANQTLTPTLRDAIRWGADITFVNRIQFRELREQPPSLAEHIYWVSEGALHPLALAGTAESLMEMKNSYDYIVMACATGTSLAGLALGAQRQKLMSKIIGVSVLNNAEQVNSDLQQLLRSSIATQLMPTGINSCKLPQLITDYQFGGYAKSTTELLDFVAVTSEKLNIPLEPVYSGKAFYAVFDLIKQNYFPRESRILLIHCGGMQANRSLSL